MLIGGRKWKNYLYTLFPFSDRNKDEVLNEINMIVKSNAIGIPLLAVIQGIVAVIGYFIFQTPDPLLFGFLTCIATIIPIVGPHWSGSVGGLYGFKRRLGTCLGIGYLCLACHYERR